MYCQGGLPVLAEKDMVNETGVCVDRALVIAQPMGAEVGETRRIIFYVIIWGSDALTLPVLSLPVLYIPVYVHARDYCYLPTSEPPTTVQVFHFLVESFTTRISLHLPTHPPYQVFHFLVESFTTRISLHLPAHPPCQVFHFLVESLPRLAPFYEDFMRDSGMKLVITGYENCPTECDVWRVEVGR
jgi:hypothetical protein